MIKKVGIVFSKPKDMADPFALMGAKRPVYEELAGKCLKRGLEMVIVSTKGYKGSGEFDWYYEIRSGKVTFQDKPIKLMMAYDRSGGFRFPVVGDSFKVVDNLEFKKFSWNKWEAYKTLGEWMPKTVWVGKKASLKKSLLEIKGDLVVLKPYNGLKGKGIYIGSKEESESFEFLEARDYLAQEFVDTKQGIFGITTGTHDLRTVIINGKIVWSHVRTPPVGEYRANVAGGGSLTEVDVKLIPESVKYIVQKVSKVLYSRFDNPIYSVDFGLDEQGNPYIFEINDQMGFPRPGMRATGLFLDEMVANFLSKIK